MKKLLITALILIISLSTLTSCKNISGKSPEENLSIPKVDEELVRGIHGVIEWSDGSQQRFCTFGDFEVDLMGGNEKYNEWGEKIMPEQPPEIEKWLCWDDYMNVYIFIKDFSITKEQFKSSRDVDYWEDKFTDEEIDLLYSEKQEEIYAYFCNPYGLTIGKHFYPPKWLYVHSLEDYIKEGITSEMLEPKLKGLFEFFGYPESDIENVIPNRIEAIYNALKELER